MAPPRHFYKVDAEALSRVSWLLQDPDTIQLKSDPDKPGGTFLRFTKEAGENTYVVEALPDAEGKALWITDVRKQAEQNVEAANSVVEKVQKKGYNESADMEQLEIYQELLGENVPASLEEYREIRYSDNWDDFQAYAGSIERGELTPLADFKLYQDIGAKIDGMLVGVTTKNGIAIAGKSKHFVARVIGSVEERRSGVTVEDCLQALTNPIRIDPVRVNSNGKSQKFWSAKVAITVNPDTGQLIQVNPLK